jgi:hypothetical protein
MNLLPLAHRMTVSTTESAENEDREKRRPAKRNESPEDVVEELWSTRSTAFGN